jgi:hypothetical protein
MNGNFYLEVSSVMFRQALRIYIYAAMIAFYVLRQPSQILG